ncbi:helix-turn-helix transcriptional regulator [Nocardia sp. CDC153]|uniref:helix-turn-helix domain-containing protein n=1 Tax=Nocardia sp. CDC153 TaxID=3112167 RepID=UPI002DBFB84B|nr:helix-turn-helix transcriptional regulator [Nocardia sp. CDC153]MEC3953823.1 helix-turn-helix transcriptional regulator [Nocardia sp. CDC153]
MAGSSLPRRALGRTLRNYRIRAGKKQSDAGQCIETSPQSVSRMEDGQPIKISTPQIKHLLDFYGMPEPNAERDEVLSLWEEVRRHDQIAKAQGTPKGWWRSYSDQLDGHFDHYLSLEAAANRLTSHQLSLIPGLLQTTEYRRALIRASELDLSPVNIERRLEFAARRRTRLDEDDFWLDALLSEAVLRHRPGGPAVMAEQLRSLAETSERQSVSVRVVPFTVDTNSGLLFHSFTLLEFPPLASRLVEPPVVYIEGYEGALYLEQAESIARFRRAIASLERVALSEDASRDLVWRIAKEYTA